MCPCLLLCGLPVNNVNYFLSNVSCIALDRSFSHRFLCATSFLKLKSNFFLMPIFHVLFVVCAVFGFGFTEHSLGHALSFSEFCFVCVLQGSKMSNSKKKLKLGVATTL